MKIVSFIEDQTVVPKILKHLGIRETPKHPPPQKIVSSRSVESIPEVCLPWTSDPVYAYVDADPVYED